MPYMCWMRAGCMSVRRVCADLCLPPPHAQIDMIKAELVFEQYLKEQHIQRTRRLRRENMNIQAFQMEHTSMVCALGMILIARFPSWRRHGLVSCRIAGCWVLDSLHSLLQLVMRVWSCPRQLVGMEKEFKALQATYTRLLDDHSRMQRQHERWERDLQAKLQKYKTENAGLAARNITLQEQHDILEGHMVWDKGCIHPHACAQDSSAACFVWKRS